MILLISASQEVRITYMSYQSSAKLHFISVLEHNKFIAISNNIKNNFDPLEKFLIIEV
jgi:hypothetical protein